MVNESIRKKPRFDINLDAYYQLDTIWKNCHIIDINLEGAGVAVSDFFQAMDSLVLKIPFEGEEYIFQCEVVYVKNFKVGVVFKNISEDDLLFIKKLINKKVKRFKI